MSPLTREAWQRLRPIFEALLDVSPGDREAHLTALAAANPDDARAVRAMLDDYARLEADGFLEGEFARPAVAEASVTRAGMRAGAYTIGRLLGRGGMGEVWLASRHDGRFDGTCAIKLLDTRVSSGATAERFEREGRLLARLNHPNIARLLDAGTMDGRPYLALEYVEGARLDDYCRDARLSVPARVRLFLDVVSAVAHAHSQLVVHRDLKPSNVLVTPGGQVKLLDFGIAKLLEAEPGREGHTLTQEGELALTPEYAAPEQLRGGDSTTATDVYQLGMLLYVLLVGRHPWHDGTGSRTERLQRALEGRVPLASDAATDATRGLLRGDLDAILEKALREQPADRYQAAAALRDDLQRYLDNEPVTARRGARSYRLRKFVARNRLSVGVSATAAVALVVALSYAVVQARVARDEARRAEDINAFILSLFESAAPTAGGGSEVRAVDLLQQSLPRIDRELADQPERQMALYLSVGRALAELNAYRDALAALGRVDDVASRHALTRSDVAMRARVETASALVGSGDVAGAAPLLDAVDRELATRPASVLQARALTIRSYLALNQSQPEAAVTAAAGAVALFERHTGRASRETLGALVELARARYHADQCAAGLPEIDDALTRVPPGDGAEPHPLTWLFRGVRARCLADLNRADEAAAEFERNDGYIRGMFGDDSKDYAVELTEHARVEHDRGRFDAALGLLARADAIYAARGLADFNLYSVSLRRVLVLLQARRLAEADAETTRMLTLVTTRLPNSPSRIAAARFLSPLTRRLRGDRTVTLAELDTLASHADMSASTRSRFTAMAAWARLLDGDPSRAVGQVEPLIPDLVARGDIGAHDLVAVRLHAGTARLDAGDVDRARPHLDAALAALQAITSTDTPERAELWVAQARVRLHDGNAAEARTFAERGEAFWRGYAPGSPWAGEAAYWLGRAFEATGDRVAAARVLERAGPTLRAAPWPRFVALASQAATRAAGPSRTAVSGSSAVR